MSAPKKSAKKKSSAKKAIRHVSKSGPPILVSGYGSKSPARRRSAKVGQMDASPQSPSKVKLAVKQALDQTHTIAAVGASAAMGYLEGSGHLAPVPEIGGLSKAAVLGAAAFIGGKMMKGQTARTLDHIATGLLSVAVYDMAKQAATTGVAGIPGIYEGYSGYGNSNDEEVF